MRSLKAFTKSKLKTIPEQVQVFTPTPSTFSSLMYHTETDPFSGNHVFVEKSLKKKENQKRIVTEKPPGRRKPAAKKQRNHG